MSEKSTDTPKWSIVGPGLVVAATGVGAADLIATTVAGSLYGYALLWSVIIGCIMKVVLVEGAGRYTLATGNTIFEGWASLGKWTTVYFGPYIVIWGFVYGAAAMAGTGLALYSLFPQLSVAVWGIISGILGLIMVWSGRYDRFEKILTFFVLLMFVTMVIAAAFTLPNLGEVLSGLVPIIPEGSMINILSVAGGVGGTITLAAYGYWLREKGWETPKFMRVMRIDNQVAYLVTGIFVVATLIVGAELLYSANIAIGGGDQGMVDLANVLASRYGDFMGKLFLFGFWAAAFSSLIGVWNGVSLMFADFAGQMRKLPHGHIERGSKGKAYKAYILWLTFPPMVMLFLGQPVYLILAYGVLGALFMPFMSVTLLWILNTDRVPREWRNGPITNILLLLCTLAFAALAINQVWSAIARVF
ncbi:Mn2+/Fe2_ transporter, NRAMP family (plasmid) [Ketogulonicigenium vulgare Y25]|uniref:Mn2+/Fe2 transporter, NRAMP family protein n=1 Tax=Ketogulonicigenium vulgare (strain WSH-001) TaxID=759362 RepID=F9YBN1_KETVW|nr:Nramp family divalent metal transporter [Ketogulonicigenium vulgare]ADO44350.1 Mn2+/Fe2_ transporter, NRAMP family [Ketogulonicigenium vulgare Y25]AEM42783.1 Mn2+/Fe2 transporter, NRAMP family protein [Ketogulonicigenium vulgare WSH-001]ALJ82777.1 iron transporter [Ketogulonicigenium vulgare]